MNYVIVSIREHPQYLDGAVSYFSSKWGIDRNIYKDCIANSLTTESPLPRWYLMMKADEIIGSYGLIANDLISRQDLWPWLCALYVEEKERGQALGEKLLAHGRMEAKKLGFPNVYLCTNHTDYYEKYGWEHIGQGFGIGYSAKIYQIESGSRGE
ncbi:GNAT family N-acetyltransferase [Anaeropeptidivorans aminofermentans]|uniref:GNAT family N-acetyltransferase n=1 Tax=Anaeropeptidivorans aminofermentans TaxID=2934315 RepID=UPI002025AD96|nr:GNAT family N-acetyltransferase [Anaeropeptidivorans aminofermentans]